MFPGLDSLPPFMERGASNGRMYFLWERKVRDCQPWHACCQGGFWILRGQKGKSVLLKTPFSAGHLIFIVERKLNIQYSARVIGFRETFVLLMKVRKRARKGDDGEKGAAHAATFKVSEQTVLSKKNLKLHFDFFQKNMHVCSYCMFMCLCVHSSVCMCQQRECGVHLWLTSCWQLDRWAVLLPHYIQPLRSLACRVLIIPKNYLNWHTQINTHIFIISV